MAEFLLLMASDAVVACLKVSRDRGPGTCATRFSMAEMLPSLQRKGLFYGLGKRGLVWARRASSDTVTASTWPFNRKAIRFFERGGFRALRGTSIDFLSYVLC